MLAKNKIFYTRNKNNFYTNRLGRLNTSPQPELAQKNEKTVIVSVVTTQNILLHRQLSDLGGCDPVLITLPLHSSQLERNRDGGIRTPNQAIMSRLL